MDSNKYRDTKVDFSYFVNLALQNKMPWNILALNFKSLAPTLNETREIISILLKELEAMQSTLQEKEKLLEKFCQGSESFEETDLIDSEDCATSVETEQELEQQSSSMQEAETLDDEIEVLEVLKDSIQEEMHLDMNKGPKSYYMQVNENDSGDRDAEESIDEIDNEWYTFVRNAKVSELETELPFEENEFHSQNEIRSAKMSEENKHNAANSVKDIENVVNDKKSDSEPDSTLEYEKIVKQAKKRPYQCTFCQKAFQFQSSLKSHENSHRRSSI